MRFAEVTYTREEYPRGPQGHANKQVISTNHMWHDKHIYSETLMDEHTNINPEGWGNQWQFVANITMEASQLGMEIISPYNGDHTVIKSTYCHMEIW